MRLDGLESVLVQGRLTPGGTLEVPIPPLEELTGEELSDEPFLSLAALSYALGPQVEVEYDPRRALLAIRDPFRSLSAMKALVDRRHAEARGLPPEVFAGGFYGSITADSDEDRLVEGGWSFGWVAVSAAHSTITGGAWGLSVQPISGTWLSYGDSEKGSASFSLRWFGGRTFARAAYAVDTEDLGAQAGISLGSWTGYVQREQQDWSGAVTLRGPVNFTVARMPDRLTTRVSFGRHPSPFSLPRVR